MTDIVKGMAQASYEAVSIKNSYAEASPATQEVCEEAMRAALLWLADNVSDEMVKAFWDQFYSVRVNSPTNKAIAAALRAAAGGGE